MKTTVRKLFVDFEKEEAWINQKCAEGFALVSYSWGKYTFEKCKPGEYIYRLELLDNFPNTPKSSEYLRLLKASGIEVVSIYGNWLYLRKRTTDGAFDIFSDRHSKIKHVKKVCSIYTTLFFTQLALGINFLIQGLSHMKDADVSMIILFCSSGMFFVAAILFFLFGGTYRKKIKKLTKEADIYE